MKNLLLTLLVSSLVSSGAIAGSFDGVPMNCLEKAEAVMASKKQMSLGSVCRDRKNPNKEFYTFGDGSSLTGFTATFSSGKCQLNDWWHGQDDQDQLEEGEWESGCLTEADFKKPAEKVKVEFSEFHKEIPAEIYILKGSVKGLVAKDVADLLAKRIRHERYSRSYSIDSHNLEKSSISKALKELSKPAGEAPAFKSKELTVLLSWIEDKQIEEVYSFTMELSQQGGSGIEQVLIFIPTEKNESVLTISRNIYAE